MFEQIFIIFTVFIFGLLFGSFATMACYRIPKGEDLVVKPSHCTSCKHRLGFFDLFPLFSWLFSGGKCRHCKAKVHWRYPAIELVMGLLFVVCYMVFGLSWTAISLALLSVGLVIMVVVDIEHKIIPDIVQIALVPVGFLYRYSVGSVWHEYISGAALGLVIALALRWGFYLCKKREVLGLGDVKFFAVAGIFLGVQGFAAFMFIAGVLGIVTSVFWKMLGRGEEFPFGPALAVALFVVLLLPGYTNINFILQRIFG